MSICNNQGFYPTPKKLIKKMLAKTNDEFKSVLEPSAGNCKKYFFEKTINGQLFFKAFNVAGFNKIFRVSSAGVVSQFTNLYSADNDGFAHGSFLKLLFNITMIEVI